MVIIILLVSASFGIEKGNFVVVGMVTLGLMVMFMTHGNLEKLKVEVTAEPFQVESVPGHISISLQNHSETEHFAISVSCPELNSNVRDSPHYLNEGDYLKINVTTPEQECGLIPIKRLKISSRYPLGLFSAWIWFAVDTKIVSYPFPKGFHWHTFHTNLNKGNIHGKNNDDFDFTGHKPYIIGDSYKRIDWRAHARGRPLVIKEFKDGGSGRFEFKISDLSHLPLDAQLGQMSLWVHEAHSQGASYSIETNRGKIPMNTGEAHFYRCLKELTHHA